MAQQCRTQIRRRIIKLCTLRAVHHELARRKSMLGWSKILETSRGRHCSQLLVLLSVQRFHR